MEKVLCNLCSKCQPPYEKWLSIEDGFSDSPDILKLIGIQGKYQKAECATIGISANLNEAEQRKIQIKNGVTIDLLEYKDFEKNINKSLAELIESNNHLFFRQWQPGKKLDRLFELAEKELVVNIDMIKCRVDKCPVQLLNNCFNLFIETLEVLRTLKMLIFNGNDPVKVFLKKYFNKEKCELLTTTFDNRDREIGQIIILKPESMTKLKIDNKTINFEKLKESNQYKIETYSKKNLTNDIDMVFIFMAHFAYRYNLQQSNNEMNNLSNMLRGTDTQ